MNERLSRWIAASIIKHFATLFDGILQFYTEDGDNDPEPDKEWIELRIIGPEYSEGSKGCWEILVEIDLLANLQIKAENILRIHEICGLAEANCSCIPIYKYGDSGDYFFNLTLDSQVDKNIRKLYYGRPPDTRVKRASVMAFYRTQVKLQKGETMAQKQLRDAVLKILDGTGTPQEVEVGIGTGNISWTETFPKEYIPERGVIADGTVREADQEPCEVTVTCTWHNILSTGSEDITPYEALRGVGAAATATWLTTGADACEPYAVDLQIFTINAACMTVGTVGERITFTEFRVENCSFDIGAGTLNFTGKCKNVSPNTVRTTTS